MALNIFTNGTVADADEVMANFNNVNLIVPIGSIIAWLKSFNNTPTLPDQFVECNGQVLDDEESVYDGQTIPNLNGAVDTGLKGYFLRGHTSSGLTESSQNLNHQHGLNKYSLHGANRSYYIGDVPNSSNETGAHSGTDYSGGTEARPHNYSVVWIMRIK